MSDNVRDPAARLRRLVEQWRECCRAWRQIPQEYRLDGHGDMTEAVARCADELEALIAADPPKRFHNSKWTGAGFGTIGEDYRVVVRRERHSARVYVQIVDDSDGVGFGFTPRQVPELIDALQRAVASLAPAPAPLVGREFLPYARLLELCNENGITETDDLKHRLEDWERWNREIRSGALTSAPAPLVGWSEKREK